MKTVPRLVAGLLLVTTVLLAHHGASVSYDTSKIFTVQATVTEFRFANPHPVLFFDVKDGQGNIMHWGGEIAPNPAQLIQAGWGRKRSEAALTPGTLVTITLAPSRNSTHVGLIEKIVNTSGSIILGTTLNLLGDASSKKH